MADNAARIDALEAEIDALHETLEAKGTNSRRVKALDGTVFTLPVDGEHKATQLPILNCSNPHMRAFHASWFGFFATFFSTFAAAPLAPTLKQENTLGLTRNQLSLGGTLAVTSNIVCRFLMGIVCDKIGARRGLAFVLLITSPAIIGMMFVTSGAGFITCRFFIGMGLASFVACQVWCTQQFSKSIVGVANATAGGWGNLGGGVTTLLMGRIYDVFLSATDNNEDLSWRLCFLVPLALHLMAAAFALTGKDLPDGNYKALERQGSKQKSKTDVVTKVGLSNVNAWILTLTYGFCFGVELTVTNIATQFFSEYYALVQSEASTIASIFGLVNIGARSLGGICSDWAAVKCGMRGRLWALFLWQMAEGVVCLVLGLITLGYTAPDFGGPVDNIGYAKIGGWVQPSGTGWVRVDDTSQTWVPFNGTCITTRLVACGSKQVQITDEMRSCLDPRFEGITKTVISMPPDLGGNCVSNSGLLGTSILLLFVFSLCVQMSEGLTYGVVPFISRPALGVVSGMVGAGGNAGSLITMAIFFPGDSIRLDTGFVYMGACVLAVTSTLLLVYFPEHGSMLTKAGSITCYDPQLIKPPAGYRGADSMDYSRAADAGSKTSPLQAIPKVATIQVDTAPLTDELPARCAVSVERA